MDLNSEVCGLLIFALEVWKAVKASIFDTVNKLSSLAYKFNRPFSYRQKKHEFANAATELRSEVASATEL